MWGLLLAIGLGVPALAVASGNWSEWSGIVFLLGELPDRGAAGVGVFGHENRAGTFRFYVHHGVRPGLVWLIKQVVSAAIVVLVWGLGRSRC